VIASDTRFMTLALSLGRRGQGGTWPNPAVGCVIVQGGRIVGRGWTAEGGRPHAETIALAQAGALAKGATAYVSLEPCAHHGATPPCANALISAGITRVVAPIEDSDERVAGRGFSVLRDAGIEVVTGICEAEALRDHAGFFARVDDGKPLITLKLASSFDGRIATQSGESQWITGPQARRLVHAMRHAHDAVMVGAGTARADDPTLLVRDLGVTRQPVRIVVSRLLDIPFGGRLAKSAGDHPLWICHGRDADPMLIKVWQDLGAKMLECTTRGGALDLESVSQALGNEGLTRVFCEGGGVLAASLLRAELVDELVAFSAGIALGGDGRAAIGAMGLQALAQAPRFQLRDQQQVGADVVHIWSRLKNH